jgi:hypothetical protein
MHVRQIDLPVVYKYEGRLIGKKTDSKEYYSAN